MASTFIDLGKVKGYIIDVANMIFHRSDGMHFLMNNGTSDSISTSKENVTISNGHLSTPRAIIDTTATTTISYSTNLTDLWLIAGMYGETLKADTSAKVTLGEWYEIEDLGESKLGFSIDAEASNVRINGFEAAGGSEQAATGKFAVTSGKGKTTIEFAAGDVTVGQQVSVVYEKSVTESYSAPVSGESKAASGSIDTYTPIYSENSENSEVVGYIIQHFPYVKVSQVPGFERSYKSESSHTIEFQTITKSTANAKKPELRIVIGK